MADEAKKPFRIELALGRVYLGLMATLSGISAVRLRLLFRYAWKRGIKRRHVPQVITVGVTNRCQCRCVHCSSNVPNLTSADGEAELTGAEVRSIIDQAIAMAIPRITFFGGEPLLRKDICDLVSSAHRKGMMTRINTNGLALTEDMVTRLKRAGLTHCDVSIDSADPEEHDRLRGVPGLFAKAVAGIERLGAHGMLCQIVTYAGKRGLAGGLQRIIELGRRLNVTSVSIVFPMASGCWFESEEELLNESERAQVRSLVRGRSVHVELPTVEHRCNVMKKSSLYVSAKGDVTPCPFIPWSLGNVRENTIVELFEALVAGSLSEHRGDCLMNSKRAREDLRGVVSQARARQKQCPGEAH